MRRTADQTPQRKKPEKSGPSLFVRAVIALVIVSTLAVFAGFAMQPSGPVDVTASTKSSSGPEGLRIAFDGPTRVTEIQYNGSYEGPYEVLDPNSSGGVPEALKLVDKAIEMNPDNATLLDTKGLIYLKDKKPQQAIPLLEKAVEISCEGPLHVLHLSYAYLSNGDTDLAIQNFDKVRPLLLPKSETLSKDNKAMFDELEMQSGPDSGT